MCPLITFPGPRYGREIVERRIKLHTAGKGWRTGVVRAYHGGYLRHTGGPGCCCSCVLTPPAGYSVLGSLNLPTPGWHCFAHCMEGFACAYMAAAGRGHP